ncbi:DUF86 domain-containing protein [bacterium]|nr:DUF86 domain-containing protein [bacterium]
MVEADVILSKISIIKNCLARIKNVTKLNPESLTKLNAEDIFILNLQRAVQTTIGMGNTIIARHNYRLPNAYKITFTVPFENDWIDQETCSLMQKMVGFRNIAIHDYRDIDSKILKSILTKNLADFEKFYKQILAKLNK